MSGVRHVHAQSFGIFGGTECFFADIDGDGRLEILTYQGPGVFGTKIYREHEKMGHVRELFPKSVSVSAFRFDGTRVWTWGEPNPEGYPYISHSYERCLSAADVDGDGLAEVVLADGDRIVMLEGKTGREKMSRTLPEDNFYIIHASGEATEKGEAAVVLKNGEAGYNGWGCGEPVIGFDSGLQQVWGPKAVPGGGHHIMSVDLNNDGRKEYLTGYCALGLDGEILWTVDSVDPAVDDLRTQHVDYTDILCMPGGKKLLAMAGSNKLYLVDEKGSTVFCRSGSHVQGSAIGRFRSDSEFQVALYNSPKGPMVLYDPRGREIWTRPTPRRWPLGMPESFSNPDHFHRNRPIVKAGGEKKNWIIYADGGWPWGMDGDGEISLEFEPPENSRQPELKAPLIQGARNDDVGYGFGVRRIDRGEGGGTEIAVYDRRHLWLFRPPE